jgi:PAS domain S-box-containing protein
VIREDCAGVAVQSFGYAGSCTKQGRGAVGLSDIGDGKEWAAFFSAAFVQSRNPMTLLDSRRCHVDVNGAYLALLGYRREELIGQPIYRLVVGGPLATPAEWEHALRRTRFTGTTELTVAAGSRVMVQWAATTEVVTGRRLVLFVAMGTSRWGQGFRRSKAAPASDGALTARELEVVRLVALGGTGPEIAEELRIAHDTVRAHARNAMAKVGARSRAHLVAKAIGDGLVSE